MKVKINEKEITLKYTFRAMMLYENILKKSFSPETTTDVLVFFYCVIISSDKDLIFPFDDFLNWVDADPYKVVEFSNFLTEEINKTKTLSPDYEIENQAVDEKDKKKVEKS